MSYDFTRSGTLGALLTCVLLGTWVFGISTLSSEARAARETPKAEHRLEAPPAASSSPMIEELKAPIRPQHYPGLPSADPLAQDPEQIREVLRLDVERALAEAPELADISILVHVTSLRRARLRGIVGNESTRILAEIIAAGVDGISGVDNGLRIEAEYE